MHHASLDKYYSYSYSISSRNGDSNGDGDEDSISEPLTKNPLNRVRLSVEIVGKVYDGGLFPKRTFLAKGSDVCRGAFG
jgi:hypothetical protein